MITKQTHANGAPRAAEPLSRASRKMALILVCACVTLFAANANATPARAQNAAGNTQNGKTIFEKMGCHLCHGSQGEGVAGSGQNAGVPRIAATSLPLADFLRQIRKPKGQMPPFSPEKVSDADLTDVYAYLQSLKPAAERQATAAESTNGERLYKSYGCYECHGYRGQGSTSTGGARLGPPRIPLSAFLSYVRQPTGQMPPYAAKAVADQDLTEIYDFLKSLPPPPALKSIPLLNQ